MAQRKPLSKTTRFEVFKRDSFTCRYCGSKAPDVILEVDHINPVSKGGDNELMNLITSCFVCNRGKGNKLLSDNTIVEKQRLQIEELNIRRQQLEMMLQWRDETIKYKDFESQKAIDFFNGKFCGLILSDSGADKIAKNVKKYGLIKVLDAIDISCDKYHIDNDSFDLVLSKVGGILNIQSMPEYRQKISYIIAICKNKSFYINNSKMIKSLTEYHDLGFDLEKVVNMLKDDHFSCYSKLMVWLEDRILDNN